eukprot:6248143-Lingulodinium_polyedra.AAC.1
MLGLSDKYVVTLWTNIFQSPHLADNCCPGSSSDFMRQTFKPCRPVTEAMSRAEKPCQAQTRCRRRTSTRRS